MGLRAAGLPEFGPWVWAGYGPETCGPGLGQTFTVWVGPGLNSSLRARAGPGL